MTGRCRGILVVKNPRRRGMAEMISLAGGKENVCRF
jgi:hypothetical protein